MLGVGDQKFYAKSMERISNFRHAGKTLLCVSHSLETLENICDRALWLERGRVVEKSVRWGSASRLIRIQERRNVPRVSNEPCPDMRVCIDGSPL